MVVSFRVLLQSSCRRFLSQLADQNNLMTMTNVLCRAYLSLHYSHICARFQVVFKNLYPKDYTSDVSTRVSNALLIGAIIGQVFVGIICDRIG
jgi:hypothetical protein